MFIRIFKNGDCLRFIYVDEDSSLVLFNLILQSLGEDENVVLYSGDDKYVIATGC